MIFQHYIANQLNIKILDRIYYNLSDDEERLSLFIIGTANASCKEQTWQST